MASEILVPLDGSRFAEQALPLATRLGRDLPAKLVLFRATSIAPSSQQVLDGNGLEAGEEVKDLVSQANDYLQGMAHSLREINPGVRYVIRHGPAAQAIVDYAAKMDMQQIVMTTRGYSNLNRWTNGSVAECVVQAANTPVLLVRGGEREFGGAQESSSCRRILVALDGSDRAEQVLPPATAIAQALRCEMILFQVPIALLFEHSTLAADRMAEAYLKHLADRLENQGIKASTAVRTGPVAETILEFADANGVDLIAMATHGRTGLARGTLVSVAAQVLRGSSTPLLLVRAPGQGSQHRAGAGMFGRTAQAGQIAVRDPAF